MYNVTIEAMRPDKLTKGDYIFSPSSKCWEPVKDAYWSEDSQRYVVWCGPLGMQLQLFDSGSLCRVKRYY